jgi:hypothetical protein
MARREYPGVYPGPAGGGRTLYRTLCTDSNGRQRQKRGFSSASAAGERRLKPFFGLIRLSAIDVQIVRNFAAEMVELVEAGE